MKHIKIYFSNTQFFPHSSSITLPMRHRSPRPHYPLSAILLQPALSPFSLPASCTPRLSSVLEAPLSSRSFDHPKVLFRPTALQQGKRARSLLRGQVQGRDLSPGRSYMYSVKTYGLEGGKFGVLTRRGCLQKQLERREIGVDSRQTNPQSSYSHTNGRLTPDQAQKESMDCFQTKERTTASRCTAFYIEKTPERRERNGSKDQRSTRLPAIYSKLKLSDSTERGSVFRPPLCQ